jgi:hypothetical protein
MAYDDDDNDGRFPDDSRVEVRYPRTRQEEHGDRAAWPWLPGSIVEQCGPDEWRVCVEDRGVAVLRDGRPAPRNTASRNLYYLMCFRDSSEIRRPASAVPKPSMPVLRVDADPGRAQDHGAGGAQGAVAVTGDRLTDGAATVVLCVVASSALIVGSIRTYALARGHGMDGTAALLVAVSLGGLIVGASLVLLGEERDSWVPGTAEGMQLRAEIWRYTRELNELGATILLTTHYLEEAEALCREIALLRAGRIIARGSPEALRRQFGVADLAGVYARAMADEEGPP